MITRWHDGWSFPIVIVVIAVIAVTAVKMRHIPCKIRSDHSVVCSVTPTPHRGLTGFGSLWLIRIVPRSTSDNVICSIVGVVIGVTVVIVDSGGCTVVGHCGHCSRSGRYAVIGCIVDIIRQFVQDSSIFHFHVGTSQLINFTKIGKSLPV